jgi:2-dehydro-3-deoxygluconokinase
MTKRIITFGEIMMRLTPPSFLRFGQARSFDVIYGGGEANVAVSLTQFGLPVDYVTRLPNNDLGEACLMFLRQYGVGTGKIVRGGDRVGIYFMENGAMQRASKVIYDRANSSFATLEAGMIDWKSVFAEASWFHWTGITPAVSAGAANTCLEAVKTAREMGVPISCDLNFRKNLWKWGRKAPEVMPELVSYCDVAIGNEEDADKVFGIKALDVDVNAGKVEADAFRFVCEKLVEKFPNLKTVAITLRGSISASHNTWSGVVLNSGTFYTGIRFDMTHIVDRVGGGDAFGAGLIYGLQTFGTDIQKALNFAITAACIKHSVFGDFNMTTVAEVTSLMSGEASGRVSR